MAITYLQESSHLAESLDLFFIPASFKSIHQSNHERLTEDIKQRSNPYKELRLEKPLYSVPTWVKCRPFLPYSYSSSLRQSMLVSATCARQGSCLIWYGLCLFAWAVENRHQHPHPDCLSHLWCFQGRCCHRCPHSSVSVLQIYYCSVYVLLNLLTQDIFL